MISVPGFHFKVPTALDGVDNQLLSPKNTWANPEQFEQKSQELMRAFTENFKRFDVDQAIVDAGLAFERSTLIAVGDAYVAIGSN